MHQGRPLTDADHYTILVETLVLEIYDPLVGTALAGALTHYRGACAQGIAEEYGSGKRGIGHAQVRHSGAQGGFEEVGPSNGAFFLCDDSASGRPVCREASGDTNGEFSLSCKVD